MSVAQKKKNTKQKTGHWTQNREPKTEGPRLGFLRIRITHGQFSAIKNSKFVRLRLGSGDGRFVLDMVIRDADSYLELVPKRMPGIMIDMDAETFQKKVEAKTIVMLDDGIRNKGCAIADIRRVGLMDSGWTFRKRMVS